MSFEAGAIASLAELLAGLEPALDPDSFVFTSRAGARYGDLASLQPVAMVQEEEGLTLVLSRSRAAAAGFAVDRCFRRITLRVHSDLDAVGLTAAVSAALAQADIPANLMAGAYHDHLYVPEARAETALSVLKALSVDARRRGSSAYRPA